MGQDFIDQLVDTYNLSVEAFTTSKTTKEDLIRFLITSFENEKIIFPSGNDLSTEMLDQVDDELSKFVVEVTPTGNEIMKGSGRSHDDTVISLALANKCTQGYGYNPFAVSLDKKKNITDLEMYAETGDDGSWMKLGIEKEEQVEATNIKKKESDIGEIVNELK